MRHPLHDQSSPTTAEAYETFVRLALMYAVERLGGTLKLTVPELQEATMGRKLDLTVDRRETDLFTFEVVPDLPSA